MVARYQRPQIPYEPEEALQYNNRFDLIAQNQQTLRGIDLDGDINYLIHAANDLYITIQATVAGILPGSNIPENANKIIATNGEEPSILYWTKITSQFFQDGSVLEPALSNGCVTSPKIAGASITSDKIHESAIISDKYADSSIDGSTKIIDESIPFDKMISGVEGNFGRYFNAQDDNQLEGSKIHDGSVNGSKLTNDTITEPKYLTGSVSRRALADINKPGIGIINAFAGTVAPSGYLFCNGQAVNRVTYALLFSAIGVLWGAGDGNTTFNVPDFRGRTIFGIDPANLGAQASTNGRITNTPNDPYQIGGNGGEELHTLTVPEIPEHSHSVQSIILEVTSPAGPPNARYIAGPNVQTGNTGGGLPHNNMPPYALSPYVIYAGV